MRSSRRWSCIALLALGLCSASRARADEDDEALLHQGVELRKQGRNAEALALFERAYEIDPSARALAQVALAEQSLGHWVRAEEGLVEALGHMEDPWIARYSVPLTKALETTRDHLGSLQIDTDVDGAEVSVDGVGVGTSPLRGLLRVVASTHVVRVEENGHGVERRVDVPVRSVAKAVVVVASDAAAQASAVPGKSAASATHAVSPATRPSPPPPSSGRDSGPSHLLPTIALIGGGALVATGVVAQVLREVNVSAYNDDSRCFYGNESRDKRCGDLRSNANASEVVAITAYGVGGVALLTGAALLLFARHGEDAPDGAVRLGAGVLPGTAYVSCAGAF